MRRRCHNVTNKDYVNYGGRGIRIDTRWDKFQNFLIDMGERPTRKHTLHRIDNNLGYSKSNCKWSIGPEQNRTKRNIVFDKFIADQIRQEYKQGGISQEKLGAKYGVSQGHVWSIVSNKLWA